METNKILGAIILALLLAAVFSKVADMAIHPWYGNLVLGSMYDSQEFLAVHTYTHVQRWASNIQERIAVKRGQRVNKVWGSEEKQLRERHNAADLD
mgnify:CR=1 FL=1